MITRTFRHLVLDNPMTLEGARFWRRFLRTGGDTGRAVNATIFVLLGVFYLWLMYAIVHFHEDLNAAILGLELMLLTLLVPASLYASVSGEREKLTWDALILTRLTPAQIVVGKLLSRLALIVGLQLLIAPLLLLSHMCAKFNSEYSGAALVLSQVALFTWSLLLAGFSLWVSTKTKRSVTTLALITSALLAFLVLLPALILLFASGSGNSNPEVLTWDGTPLQQLSACLLHLHPVGVLYGDLMRTSNHQAGDLWYAERLFTTTPWVYGMGALLCLFGSWRTLRGMEIARRSRG